MLDLEVFRVYLTTPTGSIFGHTEQGARNIVRWLRDQWPYPEDTVTTLVSAGVIADEDWISAKVTKC